MEFEPCAKVEIGHETPLSLALVRRSGMCVVAVQTVAGGGGGWVMATTKD